jgi:arylsulfatase A-like enzyme
VSAPWHGITRRDGNAAVVRAGVEYTAAMHTSSLPLRPVLVLLLAIVLRPPTLLAQPPAAARPPNILYIMSDDHAAHAIGAYGSIINTTPNIDRLAREGVRLTNCFCENSLCSPSRAAILTGTFSCRNGVIDLTTPLDPSKVTLPTLMKRAGYQTAMVGKWHLHRDPSEFDHWDVLPEQGIYHDPVFLTPGKRETIKGYVTDIITDKCIDFLEHRDKDKPFLLMCHHKAPHRNAIQLASSTGVVR